ncbi:hypothetical protein DFP72DRAFT_127353 [Ephemerocybe angulata]|nr:hypothetical protein DFP72DRAFT_127353 [Tulosesus angulatus]
MVSKTAGSNGKHGAITETSFISAASYLSLQVYQHTTGSMFTHYSDSTSLLGTNQYAHLPPLHFLMVLPKNSVTVGSDGSLRLDDEHLRYFSFFKTQEAHFREARKASKATGKNKL